MASNTKTTALTVAAASKLVSNFHLALASASKANRQAEEGLEVATRERLYATLADAFGKSCQLIADPATLGVVCGLYGVKPPAEGENPHSAVVRMFWRKKVGGKMVPDASAWKYGKGFRAAQAKGWTAKTYADEIAKVTFTKMEDGKKKIIGGHAALEAFDTELFGKEPKGVEDFINDAAAAWMSKMAMPLASFTGQLIDGPEHDQMVGLVAQYDANEDRWHVRAINQADSTRAWGSIAKPMIERFREWQDDATLTIASEQIAKLPPEDIKELLAKAGQQNRDVEAIAKSRANVRKLIGFTEDGLFAWPNELTVERDAVTSSDDAAVEDQLREAA